MRFRLGRALNDSIEEVHRRDLERMSAPEVSRKESSGVVSFWGRGRVVSVIGPYSEKGGHLVGTYTATSGGRLTDERWTTTPPTTTEEAAAWLPEIR